VTRAPARPAAGVTLPPQPPALRAGLCARPGADPGLRASSHPARRAYAKAVCGVCPALAPCAAWSLQLPPDRLVWAGLDPRQRRARAREHQAPRPAA
jgi:hypothetical protein